MTEAEKINYGRYQHVAEVLQRERYQKQGLKRGKFYPCEKGLIFSGACGQSPIPPSIVVIQEAAATICTCHNSYGKRELTNLYFGREA